MSYAERAPKSIKIGDNRPMKRMRRWVWPVVVLVIVAGLVALGLAGVNVPYLLSTLLLYSLLALAHNWGTAAVAVLLLCVVVLLWRIHAALRRLERHLENTSPGTGAEK